MEYAPGDKIYDPPQQPIHADPALNPANQHTHGHLHHGHKAHQHGNDVPTYTINTTDEPSNYTAPSAQAHNIGQGPGYGSDKKGEYDIEQGDVTTPTISMDAREVSEEKPDSKKRKFYRKYRIFFHAAIWMLFTGWWIAGLVLHGSRTGTDEYRNWVVPFLLWFAITIRIVTLHTGTSWVTRPMRWVWKNTGTRVNNMIPEQYRLWVGAAVATSAILVGTFVSEETPNNRREDRAISLFGIVVLIAGLYATSRNRRKIVWHTVIAGFLIQFIIALFVLRTGAGFNIFDFISMLARELLGFATDGLAFLTSTDFVGETFWFMVTVLPAIIFFVALVQLLYYVGLIQWFVGKFAVFFFWSMRISGAEAVVASATPFIGQGESAMLIKPFVPHLTMCEIHQVMTSGFATIAGSVLVAYIGMGLNSQVLISSCVMSIPASLAASKMRYPEEEESLTAGKVVVPDDDDHKASNALHAFANGAWLGLKIAAMILTTLLCIIAFVALINGLLTWWGRYIGLTGDYDLTIELIMGYVFYPVAFLLGVPRGPDLVRVGRLIGIKIVTNEFVAFTALSSDPMYADMQPRSTLIATYALCGFGNIGSLGTQIGVLSQIAPGRAGDVSKLAISALITGIFSTLSSAAVAGLVIQDAVVP